jgi:hypothetical protein
MYQHWFIGQTGTSLSFLSTFNTNPRQKTIAFFHRRLDWLSG